MGSAVRAGAPRRWAVVASGVALLCALPVVIAAWPARAATGPPDLLRDAIVRSGGRPYQGYVESRGQIALPSLPQMNEVAELFDNTTNARVWHAGSRAWRVAVLEANGEEDVYAADDGTYTWDYRRNLLTHIVGDLPVRLPWAADVVPPELARRLLSGTGPGDRLSPLPARRVAGVSAAGLRLVPGDPDTTVGHVDVWADPRTGVALRVDVTARTGTAGPVFTSRFLDFLQRAPDPGVLTPDVAGSAGSVETAQHDIAAALDAFAPSHLPPTLAGRSKVDDEFVVTSAAAYGEGISRFAAIPLPRRFGSQTFRAMREAGAGDVPLPGGAHGYALANGVLTVLAVQTRIGETALLAGLVSLDLLTRAAADLPVDIQ
jgi:hypothetical protein